MLLISLTSNPIKCNVIYMSRLAIFGNSSLLWAAQRRWLIIQLLSKCLPEIPGLVAANNNSKDAQRYEMLGQGRHV